MALYTLILFLLSLTESDLYWNCLNWVRLFQSEKCLGKWSLFDEKGGWLQSIKERRYLEEDEGVKNEAKIA